MREKGNGDDRRFFPRVQLLFVAVRGGGRDDGGREDYEREERQWMELSIGDELMCCRSSSSFSSDARHKTITQHGRYVVPSAAG